MSSGSSGVAVSVRQRLKNLAQRTGGDFQDILFRYAAERLLYRLSVSPYSSGFILKEATLFTVWSGGTPHRATQDLDLLGFGNSSVAEMERIMREVAAFPVEDDGITFDPASVKIATIGEQRMYSGIRAQLVATLAGARITVRVDIGFGDAVHPSPAENVLPTLLDMAAPVLRLYPKETVIAEKFHAMVLVGTATSRFKDFYDIWVLARDFAFDGEIMKEAIAATFSRRQTLVPSEPPDTLCTEFWSQPSSLALWNGFLKRSEITGEMPGFAEVATSIVDFVLPPTEAAANGKPFALVWLPGGPWSQRQ